MTPPLIDPFSFACGFASCFACIAWVVHVLTRRPK